MSDPQSIKEPAAAYSAVADSARLKYQTALRHFEVQYPQGFTALREAVAHEQAGAEQEQDYFDWELAVTDVSDMTAEIKRLKRASKAA
jgi:hypothetical protein